MFGIFSRRVGMLFTVCVIAAVIVAVVLATRSKAESLPHTSAAQSLRVVGNKLVFGPGKGKVVQLRGVNRSGAEYRCVQPSGGFFDSATPDEPDSNAMIAEMAHWDINVVRLPLNEGCWLGINSPNPDYNGQAYRNVIKQEVARMNAHHLFVILALQWNGANSEESNEPLPMADASHAPAFWKSVATAFKGDGLVMFDLFNEPHGISWKCWQSGCYIPPSKYQDYGFEATGMQQMINAVRGTGNSSPLIISGPNWALELQGIYTHKLNDPDHSLIYAIHTYGGESPCVSACQTTALDAAKFYPVVYSEIGEFDCGDSYLQNQLPVLDKHGVGYLAWAWDAVSTTANGWSCNSGPSLIDNYGGTPTPYGAGYHDFLAKLGEPVRP